MRHELPDFEDFEEDDEWWEDQEGDWEEDDELMEEDEDEDEEDYCNGWLIS
jgi:hypothetical protein